MKRSIPFRILIVSMLVLTLFACTFCVYACSSTTKKTIGDADAGVFNMTASKSGKKVDVTVDLKKNPGYNFLRLTLDYDATKLTFTGYDEGKALKSMDMLPTNPNTELGYSITPFIFLYGPLMNTNDTSTGTVITLHFTVKSAAEEGETLVGLKYNKGKDITHFDGESSVAVNPQINYASVTIG